MSDDNRTLGERVSPIVLDLDLEQTRVVMELLPLVEALVLERREAKRTQRPRVVFCTTHLGPEGNIAADIVPIDPSRRVRLS